MPKRVAPQWVAGTVFTAPALSTLLLQITPTFGTLGLVYGLRITTQEVNAAGKVWQFGLGPAGISMLLYELDVLNPIIDSNIPLWGLWSSAKVPYSFTNLVAGTAATRHQAWIKYAEISLADINEGVIL